tara:strand:- start:1270 stop:3249 length:1980 start_codon:yes stop_codon:yes gene_type:complete
MKKQFTKPAKQAKNLKPKKETAASEKPKPAKTTTRRKKLNTLDDITPISASLDEAVAGDLTRRNKSATIERTNRFKNIDDGLIPFKHSGTYQKTTSIVVKDAVILCQKAYYNYAMFRNVIDLMTEFSSSNIYFRGGSKKSREFLEAYFKKINLWGFQEKFFREYYRSGNVFTYRFDAVLQNKDLKKITKTFGSLAALGEDSNVPVKYIVLNPADITMVGNISFNNGSYFKVISDYELERLKNPQTEEDKLVLENLPEEAREQLLNKREITSLSLPLSPEKVSAVFYKKQDYEPFAVPMGYPVLEDINWKAEMKKMDMAITRTMQQAILLVTMGAEPDKGGINQKNLAAMQKIFDNESVGRVLIADYTTKAEFVIPDIANLLDPKKYAVVNEDIKQGLNHILVGDEKFANSNIKVKVFIERLRQAREAFINEFLIHEVKRICKNLGFKNYPKPVFEDIDIKDADTYTKVYTRMVELGILTPEEALKAIETGKLPDAPDSVESQEKFKQYRDQGLYEPLIGGGAAKEDVPKENGRPEGSGTPQTTKNVKPVGTGQGYAFVMEAVKKNMVLAQKLESEVCAKLREMHNVKRMSKKQKIVASDICEIVMANELPQNWISKAKEYCEEPKDKNLDRVKQIQELACEHQVDNYVATILYASKKEK